MTQKFFDIIYAATEEDKTPSEWFIYPEVSDDTLKCIRDCIVDAAVIEKSFSDLCIEKQYEEYWQKKQPIGRMRIWSYDHHLAGIQEKQGGLSRRRDI